MKKARFPEGESVDVPAYLREHGNPEAADQWEAMNEEYGDKLKTAALKKKVTDWMWVISKDSTGAFLVTLGDPRKPGSKVKARFSDPDTAKSEIKYWVKDNVGKKVSPNHIIDLTGLRLVPDTWDEDFQLLGKVATPIGKGKNGYIAFYKGKKVEVMADTAFQAQTTAAQFFKVKPGKSYEVNVVLVEKDGKQVTHRPLFAAKGPIIVMSAIKSPWVPGVGVGVTPRGSTVIFLLSDYDNKGHVEGPYEDVSLEAGAEYFPHVFYMLGYKHLDEGLKAFGPDVNRTKRARANLVRFAQHFLARATKEKKESTMKTAAHRPLWQIAKEIRNDWKNVNYAAKPYLSAMGQLDKITDDYGADSAVSVVLYFLSNATSWRGDVAKQIKAELKAMASGRRGSVETEEIIQLASEGTMDPLDALEKMARMSEDPLNESTSELEAMLADFDPGKTEFEGDDRHPELDEGSLIPGIEDRKASKDVTAFSQKDADFVEWAYNQPPMGKAQMVAALRRAGVRDILPPREKRPGPRYQEGDDVLIEAAKHTNPATLEPYKEWDGKVGKVVGLEGEGAYVQFKSGQPVFFPDAQKLRGVGIYKYTAPFDMEGSDKLEIIYEAGRPAKADRVIVVQQYKGRGKSEPRKAPYFTGHAFMARYNKSGGIYFSLFPQQRLHVDPQGEATEAGYEATSINPDVGVLYYLGAFGKRPHGWEEELEQMREGGRPSAVMASEEDDDLDTMLARYEEGVPADPTENMSPEEAKKWKDNTEQYGDKFKTADADEDMNDDLGDDFLARFEEGKPADPTKDMSPEDAAKWKAMNEEHKDEFKMAREFPSEEALVAIEEGKAGLWKKPGNKTASDLESEWAKSAEEALEDRPFVGGDRTAAKAPTGLYGFTRKVQSDCETAARKLSRHATTLAKRIYAKDERVVDFLTTHAKRGSSLPARVLLAAMREIGPRVAAQKTGSAEAEELKLYIDNENTLHRQVVAIRTNLLRKMVAGRYSHPQAPKLWLYVVDEGAKKYTKEFGDPGIHWAVAFPKPVREEAARELAEDFLTEVRVGGITPSDYGVKGELPPRLASLMTTGNKTATAYGLYGFGARTANLGLVACTDLREQAGMISSDLHRRRADAYEPITGFLGRHAKEGKCLYSRLLHASYPEATVKLASGLVESWLEWED